MVWLPDSSIDQPVALALQRHLATGAAVVREGGGGGRPVVLLSVVAARLSEAPADGAPAAAPAADPVAAKPLGADAPRTVLPTLFGAVGDGAHPAVDQAAFQQLVAAIEASRSAAPTGKWDYAQYQSGALIEPGIYDAGGLMQTEGSVRLVARIPGTVIIRIPAGQYFMTVAGRVNAVVVDGITFLGGKGAFLFTNTANNVNLLHQFTRNVFLNYTECAICNNASDHPYLRVQGNVFLGAGGVHTIGVGWGGYVDQGVIEDNAFLQNAYHLAIGPRLGSTMMIRHNDFINWGDATNKTLADVWLKPNTTDLYGVNAGYGITLADNKFGNENQNLAAPRILVANENTAVGINGGTPTGRQNYSPSTGDNSTAYLAGVSFTNNIINGSGGITAPVIQSNISNVRELYWRRNQFPSGTYPYIFTFLNSQTLDYTNTNSDFEFGAADAAPGGFPAARFSNAAFAELRDYAGFWPGDANAVEVWPVSDDPQLTLLATDLAPGARTAFGGASLASVAGPGGAADYQLVSVSAAGGGAAMPLTRAPAGGGRVFVELALAQAPARSLSTVLVEIANPATGQRALMRRVTLPAGYGRLIAPVLLPASAAPGAWVLRVSPVAGPSGGAFITGGWVVNMGPGRMGRQAAWRACCAAGGR